MEKIKKIIKKLLTKEVILYIVFGLLTTVVNLGTFYVLHDLFNINENVANFIAILLAVLTAYVTNKDLVFHSEAKTFKNKMQEFFKFMLGRTFTMVVEFVGGLLLFQTAIPEMISKVAVTIVVVILNFFISKFFAFKNTNVNTKKGE